MRNKLVYIVLAFICFQSLFSQELKCSVSVNYDRMTDVNPQIFKNLEKQLTEFLNTTKWTTKEYKQNEKINCNFFTDTVEIYNSIFDNTFEVILC